MAGSLDEARQWLVLADEAISAAATLMAAGHAREAVSRSYYAMFYAAKAAAITQGIHASKHRGVISAFGRLFAKTGLLPARLHSYLIDAFEDRQDADYELIWQVDMSKAELRLAQAREFVSAVGRLLSQADDRS